jgi:plastocyanin
MRTWVLIGLAVTAIPLPASAGEVAGVVRYRGAAPTPARLPVTKDRPACGDDVPDETLLVSGGGLANVVVRLVVPGAVAAPRTITLDQRGCRFLPHVLAAPAGSTVELLNGDPILHGVHAYRGVATAFDVPMALQGQRRTAALPRPGIIQVGCDIHGWMTAWIVVVEGPHVAVTDASGRFTLGEVPPGTYPAIAWHERLGERTASVTVPASGRASLELVYP